MANFVRLSGLVWEIFIFKWLIQELGVTGKLTWLDAAIQHEKIIEWARVYCLVHIMTCYGGCSTTYLYGTCVLYTYEAEDVAWLLLSTSVMLS